MKYMLLIVEDAPLDSVPEAQRREVFGQIDRCRTSWTLPGRFVIQSRAGVPQLVTGPSRPGVPMCGKDDARTPPSPPRSVGLLVAGPARHGRSLATDRTVSQGAIALLRSYLLPTDLVG